MNYLYFTRGLTHDLGKKFEISSEFVSLSKGLDMMFDGTLGKKVFLDNKNVTKFGEKCTFSKRLTYHCGQKVEISSA